MNLTKKRLKKLDELSQQTIINSIEKMKTLLNHYTGEYRIGMCPLCKIGESYSRRCNMCPWNILLNIYCNDYFNKSHKDLGPRVTIGMARGNPRIISNWWKQRREDLQLWIKLYKKYYKQKYEGEK